MNQGLSGDGGSRTRVSDCYQSSVYNHSLSFINIFTFDQPPRRIESKLSDLILIFQPTETVSKSIPMAILCFNIRNQSTELRWALLSTAYAAKRRGRLVSTNKVFNRVLTWPFSINHGLQLSHPFNGSNPSSSPNGWNRRNGFGSPCTTWYMR